MAGQDERRITTEATVRDAKDRVCVTATATMLVLDAAQARDAIGSDAQGRDAEYLRGQAPPAS